MAIYYKEDLLFSDYEWNEAISHVKLQGSPDRNLFIPHEGNQMLYMINYACEIMSYTSKTDAGRMEILLHEKLPSDIKSQNRVFAWLQKEYNALLTNEQEI
jgi:hypothetical protein